MVSLFYTLDCFSQGLKLKVLKRYYAYRSHRSLSYGVGNILTDVHGMRYVFVGVTENYKFEVIFFRFYRRLGRLQRFEIVLARKTDMENHKTHDRDF